MANKIKTDKIKTVDQDYEEYRQMIAVQEYENILNLLLNSVKIKGLPDDVPENIVKRWLFEIGGIGDIKFDDMRVYAKFAGTGVDIYGMPEQYTFITANGLTITLKKDSENLNGLLYIKPDFKGVRDYLWQRTQELAYIRMCMMNNLIATENQLVYECPDVNTVTQMKTAYKKREIGMPVIFAGNTNKALMENVNVLGKDVPFVADKLLALYTNIRNEILEHFGILAGNTDKKERVQSMEITSQVGYVIDNIYMFIETFNYYSKFYNLGLEMELNSTVEELYADYQTGENQNDKGNDF